MRDAKAAIQWVAGYAANGKCLQGEGGCVDMGFSMDAFYPLFYDKPENHRASREAAKAHHVYKPSRWSTEDDPTNQHKVSYLFFRRLYLFLKSEMERIGCVEQFELMINNPNADPENCPGLRNL